MRLYHSRPADPGDSRKRRGRGFGYLDAHGEPLRDPAELARARALVIPPASRDVWICARPNGHLQAVAAALPALGADDTPGTPATRGAVERAVLRMLRTGRSPRPE